MKAENKLIVLNRALPYLGRSPRDIANMLHEIVGTDRNVARLLRTHRAGVCHIRRGVRKGLRWGAYMRLLCALEWILSDDFNHNYDDDSLPDYLC